MEQNQEYAVYHYQRKGIKRKMNMYAAAASSPPPSKIPRITYGQPLEENIMNRTGMPIPFRTTGKHLSPLLRAYAQQGQRCNDEEIMKMQGVQEEQSDHTSQDEAAGSDLMKYLSLFQSHHRKMSHLNYSLYVKKGLKREYYDIEHQLTHLLEELTYLKIRYES